MKRDAIVKAIKVREYHETYSLSRLAAWQASEITIMYALKEGLYPGYQSVNKRVLNYIQSEIEYAISGIDAI